MRHYYSKFLAVFLLALATSGDSLRGQTVSIGKGSGIQGTVLASDGLPLAGAVVTALRAMVAPQLRQSAVSAANGSFSIQNVPEGTYRLCVQARGGTHLDPCLWSTKQTDVVLPAGLASAGNKLSLKKASKLQVRITDPNHFVAPRSSQTEPPKIVMGVPTPSGLVAEGRLLSADKLGRTFEIPVPFDTPLTLNISGKKVKMTDDKDVPIQSNGGSAQFVHSSGASSQPGFTFKITGRAE